MEKNWNDRIEFEELIVDRYEGEKAARKYLADNRRKRKIKKVITGVIDTVIVISAVGIILTHCTSNKEVPASTKAETETTTELTTEEPTTTVVKVEKECLVTDVVGNAITVECEDNLYEFYGEGYEKGQKVICTFENEKITDASEPIIEEPEEMEIKFFDVPLSEDIQLHIFSECEKYNIAPALVIAIIERESTFNADRIGDNGKSFGLMQVQPQWHSHRITELGYSQTDFDWLNPYDNISVGCHFLNELFGKYGDDLYTVLMGYNGSPQYVKDMTSQGLISDYALEVSARAEQLEKEIYEE